MHISILPSLSCTVYDFPGEQGKVEFIGGFDCELDTFPLKQGAKQILYLSQNEFMFMGNPQ